MNHWPLPTELFASASKVWQSYIQKICHDLAAGSAKDNMSFAFPKMIDKQASYTWLVVKKSREIAKFSCKEKKVYVTLGGHEWLPPKDAIHNHMTMKQPLGDIVFTTIGQSVSWADFRTTYTSTLGNPWGLLFPGHLFM